MPNRSLFISAFLLVLLHVPFNSAEPYDTVTIPYTQSITMASNDKKFYLIDISQIPQGVDITLSVISKKDSAPKLYASKNSENQLPQDTNADYFASVSGSNIIFIPGAQLAGNPSLYVGLLCARGKCEADLTFEYSKEINIEADGRKAIETSSSLQGASSAVVRLSVPDTPNAERIVIHVDAIPNDDTQVNPDLSVFINRGNDIPFTSHTDNIPRVSWFEGRTIVIYKETQLFCTDCNYTLSLKFSPSSAISVEAHVFEVDMPLRGQTVLDGVKKDRSNSYSFIVDERNKDDDLLIDVKPQEGKPTVYIACDTRPQNFRGYYWIYEITKPLEIIMTPTERARCQSPNFFVLVASNDPSVFSIRITQKEASKLFVGKDDPIMGDIFPGETVTHEVFIPLFAAENLRITLGHRNPLAMTIINCRFPTDCPGLLPGGLEFRHQIGDDAPNFQPPEFKYNIEELPNAQVVSINPHEDGCYPIIIKDEDFMQDPIPVCAYKITLTSSNLYPAEYSLQATSQGHQWLFLGLPKLGSVLEAEVTFFVVNVPHQNVDTITIQVTTFSGDVEVYVSKEEKYPSKANDLTTFSHEGMIIFKDKPDLAGTYFIGVSGLETSSFSLVVTVLTKDGKQEDYAQTLTEGVPQKGVLLPKHEHPARFYKLKLDKDKDWKGTIHIAVNTLRGPVLIAVNADSHIPLPNSHTWKGANNIVEISSTDIDFRPDGTYYIGVFIDWEVVNLQLDELTYNIVYSLKETTGVVEQDGKETPAQVNFEHLFFSPLTPYHRTLKKNDVDYYEAFILPRDTGITIFKQADSGDVDVFVSLTPDNEYPDESNYNLSTKTTHKDYITLDEDQITQTCEAESSKLCTFYIAVVAKGDQKEVSYSLSMKREYVRAETGMNIQAMTPLEDGRQFQGHVPEGGKPAYFYFYTVPFNPSVVTISCPGEEIRIFANMKITEIGNSSKPNIDLPTAEKYDFTSSVDTSSVGLVHLTVPPQFILNSTVVAIAVYFTHPDREAGTLAVDSATQFSVLVSSHMTHIYTGKPYYGAVEKGKYMYFTLNVYKEKCTLLISMTTLDDGDPDLIVSNSKEDLPTIAAHKFASISNQRTELLEINESDIYPKNSMEGTWVIGVYGRTTSTFTLTVLDEEEKMVQLKTDVPFEMYIKEDSKMYFKYYHGKPDTVDIKIEQISGDIMAYVKTISSKDGEVDLVDSLPHRGNSTWDVKPSTGKSILVNPSDDGACSECLYLITLEADKASKFIITVSEGDRVVKLQNGLTYTLQLDPLNTKTYVFSSKNAEEVTLTVNLKGQALNIYASNNPEVSEENKIASALLTADHPYKILSLVKSEFDQGPKFVNNGIKDVPSEKDSFYIMFENPISVGGEISCTFTVTSADSSPILKSGSKHRLELEKGEASSLIYYASKDDEIVKLNIEFTVEKETGITVDQEFEKYLTRGIPVTATFWGEKVTAGRGRDVPMDRDHVMRDSVKTSGANRKYTIRQGLTFESKKGKFSFDLENPFNSNIIIGATVYSSEFGVLDLEPNSQHSSTLAQGMSETFEFRLDRTGAWYIWVFSCTAKIDVNIASDINALGTSKSTYETLEKGEGYLYLRSGQEIETQFAELRQIGGEDGAQFIVNSKFFSTPVDHSYEEERLPTRVSTKVEFDNLNNKVLVDFENTKIKKYSNEADVIYHVKLCPYRHQEAAENLCNIQEDCKLFQVSHQLASQPNNLEASFTRVQQGKYYLQITADVHHNGEFIKFVPYPVQVVQVEVSTSEKVSSHLGVIALVLACLLIVAVACYIGYGKLKKYGEEKGFELPTIGKKSGYGFVGDDY